LETQANCQNLSFLMSRSSSAWAVDPLVDLLAGALGATASVYVGQPLDTIKVKMQTFPHLYPSLTICARHTLEREGVRGLYSGTIPALTAIVAENSILFAAYGATQRLMTKAIGVQKVEDLSVVANGVSGSMAAFWASLALCPTELVKCRLQALQETSKLQRLPPPSIGPWRLTSSIIRQEGVSGMYRHLLSLDGCRKEEIGPFGTVVSGRVAGVTLWTIIFPVDVVKSRLQVSGLRTPLFSMLVSIYRTEGLAALYSGLGPTLLRTVPATGSLFLVFETTKRWIHQILD